MDAKLLTEPILIRRPAALERLASELSSEPIIAVDTESNSLYAYQEKVCLIQFSTPRKDYLVDPLALKSLSPLDPVFRSPKIEKVFHAAEYDLLCLKRDFGFEFNNLFDTMIAAGILGRQALGLGTILKDEYGVQVDKRNQRANWGQRPLPENLLKYAQLDTHYLIPLRNRLLKDLLDSNLMPLAEEDFKRISDIKLNANGGYPPRDFTAGCWRISGAYDLEPQNAAVLLELCRYRDAVARSNNRPLFKVLGNQVLFSIAELTPKSLDEISQVPGMSDKMVKRHGRKLLGAVKRGMESDPVYPPRHARPGGNFLRRLESLRRWRKLTAQDMGVSSDVVLPRDLMYTLAKRPPQNVNELVAAMEKIPWRCEQFGDQILAILNPR